MIISCPLPAALTAIPLQTCPFKLDQIVRFAFQRRQPSSAQPFLTLSAFQTLAGWTAFKAASGDTKVVMSPIFAGMVIPKSEALTTGGGDNSTFNGLREYNGENSVTITGLFKNMAPVVKRAIDALAQESLAGSTGLTNLTLYPINKDGYMFPVNPPDGAGVATTIYKGIDVYNFRISSLGSQGFNSPNDHDFSFDMPANWADYLTSVKPSFDPLTEI